MQIAIDIKDEASDALGKMEEGLGGGREGLHRAMGMGVETLMKDNPASGGYLTRANKLGAPWTGWWKSVHD